MRLGLVLVLATLAAPSTLADTGKRGWLLETGLSLGVGIPGDQDLKMKRNDASGGLVDFLFTDTPEEQPGVLVGGHASLFGRRGITRSLGLRCDLLYWQHDVVLGPLEDRLVPASSGEPFPFDRISQGRLGLMLGLVGRLRLGHRLRADVGLGGGGVHTWVRQGHRGWGYGFQILGGLATPIGSGRRLRLDFRYLLAPEADPPAAESWRVEVSGTPYWPYLAHHDTRYFMLSLGIEFGD